MNKKRKLVTISLIPNSANLADTNSDLKDKGFNCLHMPCVFLERQAFANSINSLNKVSIADTECLGGCCSCRT